MKRLFASAAIVAIAAIGIPIAIGATASAAAPSTGALDKAWTHACATVSPQASSTIQRDPVFGAHYVCVSGFVYPSSTVPPTNALEALCGAMGGGYGQTVKHDGVSGLFGTEQFCLAF